LGGVYGVGWIFILIIDFPVTEYGGTKTLVLSTRTVIGGQNNFLGIAYIVVAGLCILLGAIFTARHLIKPRYPPTPPTQPCMLVLFERVLMVENLVIISI
jgi:hypothetical protein